MLERPAQDANDQLSVRESCLETGSVADGDVDLAFVAAVLPLVDRVVAGPALRSSAQIRTAPSVNSTVTSRSVTAGTGATITKAPGAS